MAHSVTKMSKEENQEMMAVWPDVVRDITDEVKSLNIPDVAKWLAKVLEYNVPSGKKNRALTLIHAYKLLAPSDQLTEENIRLVRILAWCTELMQAYFIVLDDIIDRSLFRRGQPCWCRYNDIGLMAINDGIMIESVMYYLVRKHFKGKDYYINLLETFQDIILKTILGECLELQSTKFSMKSNLDRFTMNRYHSIVTYKASYYSFILPVTAAMHVAGIKDPEMFQQAKTILLGMGQLFQTQDDYLDVFGDSEVTGKDSTDIQEGKCAWPIVEALQRATPTQRKILEECYGVSDPEKVARVKQLFTEMDLPDAYSKYEKKMYDEINTKIEQISCSLPRSVFQDLLETIFRRES